MKKIKLVHIVYSFELGGIETLLLSLLNRLDKDKYEIHLITLTNDKLALISSLDTNVKVHSLDYTSKKLKSFNGLYKGLKDLVKLLKIIKPMIIHNHLTSYYLLFVLIGMKLSNLKLKHFRTIHTAGSFYGDQSTIISKLRLYIEQVSMKNIETHLISVSKTVHKNNILYFQKFVKDIKLISNGVDMNKYNKNNFNHIAKNNFRIESNKVVITYVARVTDGKNHDLLIDIFIDVSKEVPNAILVIAGDGELRNVLEQKVKSKYIENIIFLGAINNIPELLSITDIGVFPSSFEGFGLVMLEKLAMKLPIVASDIEPFREIVKDKESAFLVSLDDKKKFVESIVALCKDEKLKEKMGEQAYLAAKKFSIENTIKEHDEYYNMCLSEETVL